MSLVLKLRFEFVGENWAKVKNNKNYVFICLPLVTTNKKIYNYFLRFFLFIYFKFFHFRRKKINLIFEVYIKNKTYSYVILLDLS